MSHFGGQSIASYMEGLANSTGTWNTYFGSSCIRASGYSQTPYTTGYFGPGAPYGDIISHGNSGSTSSGEMYKTQSGI